MAEQPGLKVVHVVANYPPSIGGSEKVVQSLATRRDAENTLVLTSRLNPAVGSCEPDDFVRRFRALEISNTKIMPGLAGQILRLPRGTLIHLHVTSAFLPETVYIAHALRGVPYIAQLHIDISTSSCWAGFALRRAWMPAVLPRVLRGAAAVVVFTDEQRRWVASEYGLDPARIVTTRNGVEDVFFNDDDRGLHAKPRLLFVGRLAPEKNLSVLLKALVGISDRFEIKLVGDGPAELELKRMAASLGLHNVHFHGRAIGEELRDAYRTSDVLVLPSRSEGMSLVLLEAIAMGLPVVATDLSGTREVVVHGENGLLVAPDDAAGLRFALLDIVDDNDRFRSMSKASRKLAEQYRWDRVCGDFERLYAQARAS